MLLAWKTVAIKSSADNVKHGEAQKQIKQHIQASKTNQAQTTAIQWLKKYSRGWSDSNQSLHFITGWGWGGHTEDLPMLLTVARLSVPLLLLSLRSMALGWFHSSLHCHPEQINVTMRKARAALFLRRANSLFESLSDLLYSPSSLKNTLKGACLPSLIWLGYGANDKVYSTQPLYPSVLINWI